MKAIAKIRGTIIAAALVIGSATIFSGTASAIDGGASVTSPNPYGFVASVYVDTPKACTGALISREWIITAKHCFEGYSSQQVVVRVGGTTFLEGITRVATGVVLGEKSDLALVKIPAVDDVAPVALAKHDDGLLSRNGTKLTSLGFGGPELNKKKQLSGAPLRRGTEKVTDQTYSTSQWRLGYSYLMKGEPVNGNTVGGDSGGPLLSEKEGAAPVLVGVLSGGNGFHSSAYTKIRSTVPWIDEVTGL